MNFIPRIRATLGLIAALGSMLFLAGCFQIEQVLNIKADGSGTVVMSIKMTKEMIEQMKTMAKTNGGGNEAANPIDGMLSEEEAKTQAKEMGESVKFEKVETIKDDKSEGRRATYSFADVTKLKMDIDLSGMKSQGAAEPGKEKDAMTFEFTKGSPAKLVINALHKKPAGKKEEQPEDPNEAAGLAMAQQFLKDTRLTIIVNVEGSITETNAANKDGSRVILADIPFGDLLKDPAKLKGLKNAETWEEATKLFKDIPSIKMEPREKIEVKFK